MKPEAPQSGRGTAPSDPPEVVDRIEREVRAQIKEEELAERDRIWETSVSSGVEPLPDKPPTQPVEPRRPAPGTQGLASDLPTQTSLPPTPAFSPPAVTRTVLPPRQSVRRVDVTIRRLDPWSVLKFSIVFYFSVMVIFVLAAMLLFFIADAAGYVGNLEKFIQGVGWPNWQIRPVQLFRLLLLIGIINVICWSAVNIVITFLYNLVSDVVGGIRAHAVERDI